MRERVSWLDGELDRESAPDHGTAIRAWVPPRKVEGQGLNCVNKKRQERACKNLTRAVFEKPPRALLKPLR